jgi:2-hydroxychromene-2-carboxylate isomerase
MSYKRSFMQKLYENTTNIIKDEKIHKIVKSIYIDTLQFAERNSTNVFVFDFSKPYTYFGEVLIQSITNMGNNPIREHIKKEDILDNIEEIISSLKTIFPECDITHKSVPDRIVIDWS